MKIFSEFPKMQNVENVLERNIRIWAGNLPSVHADTNAINMAPFMEMDVVHCSATMKMILKKGIVIIMLMARKNAEMTIER